MNAGRIGIVICSIVAAAFAQTPSNNHTDPSAEKLKFVADQVQFITGQNTPETRRTAAEYLVRLDSPEALEELGRILRNGISPEARVAVCQAVAGESAPPMALVEPLLQLLGATQEEVRGAAGRALSAYRDRQVFRQLTDIAASAEQSETMRLGAILALAVSIDDQDAIGQLIELLAAEDAAIRNAVIESLRPASRIDYGADPAAWRAWHERMKLLSEVEWLRDRLKLLAQRFLSSEAEFQTRIEALESSNRDLARRLAESLNTHYAQTNQNERKNELLVSWLSDTMPEVRQTAVSLIRIRLQDGELPSEEVKSVLAAKIADPSIEMRRSVLLVLTALGDDSYAEPILARLADETDPGVRQVMYRALGTLGNPIAIETLLDEITNPDADAGTAEAAALALGTICAASHADAATVEQVVEPLVERFAMLGPEQDGLRAAMLSAMARIGSPEFKDIFEQNLRADAPEIREAALSGLAAVGAASQLPDILRLLNDGEPRVRQAAALAVGNLGRDDQSLEALFGRLNPDTEPHQLVRDSAWQAFMRILRSKPVADRLQWADRFRKDAPARYVALLSEIEEDPGTNDMQLTHVCKELAERFEAQGQFWEAAAYYRKLYRAAQESKDGNADGFARQAVNTMLDGRHYVQAVEFAAGYYSHTGSISKRAIDELFLGRINSLIDENRAPDAQELLQSCRRTLAGVGSVDFGERLDALADRLAPPKSTTNPALSP